MNIKIKPTKSLVIYLVGKLVINIAIDQVQKVYCEMKAMNEEERRELNQSLEKVWIYN